MRLAESHHEIVAADPASHGWFTATAILGTTFLLLSVFATVFG